MKDLNSEELARYKELPPYGSAVSIFKQITTFEFPIPNNPKGAPMLKAIVSSYNDENGELLRISASVMKPQEMLRPITEREVYLLRDYLQNQNETLMWEYDIHREEIRANTFRMFTGQNFDMNSYVINLYEFNGELPPLEEAYGKKVQKHKKYFYSRGTVQKNQFIHLKTENVLPWEIIKAISAEEFGTKSTVQVFFNDKTHAHPNEYIVWRK